MKRRNTKINVWASKRNELKPQSKNYYLFIPAKLRLNHWPFGLKLRIDSTCSWSSWKAEIIELRWLPFLYVFKQTDHKASGLAKQLNNIALNGSQALMNVQQYRHPSHSKIHWNLVCNYTKYLPESHRYSTTDHNSWPAQERPSNMGNIQSNWSV